ncbi:Shedu immune nuclease family protein [Chitinimonas sp. JJ19]|uniref:Shedu immune nuclease family protein n=1 Tax=Chitinimonas sp. JJ19 TaxID=3109352 RepID=UPI003001C83A
MQDEAEIHRNKIPGKTYISPQIDTPQGPLRIASKVIDSEGLHFATVKDEVVLRRTPTGRTEIVAKYLEDSHQLTVVTLQAFNGNSGVPQKTHFSFVGAEISKLLTFFGNVAAIEPADSGKVNIADSELSKLILSREQAAHLVKENQDVFSEAMQSGITKEDIVALGYRKKQLDIFERLLSQKDYFDALLKIKKLNGNEALWQAFFERNQWIFGYGLSYVFVTGFDGRKLEQLVEGYDLVNYGKRADAFMQTRGIINTICFVEIKTHETDLLGRSYRSGCWAPSAEMVGAVAQVQGTVDAALRNLYGLFRPNGKDGAPTGEEAFNFRPKAFIVIGSLGQFKTDEGVNQEKFRSFE